MQDQDGTTRPRAVSRALPTSCSRAATLRPTRRNSRSSAVDEDFRKRYMYENERLAGSGAAGHCVRPGRTSSRRLLPSADLLPSSTSHHARARGIVDPARPTANRRIATAKSAGIRVRMITGDHAVTAAAIARELVIEGRAITGAELGAFLRRRSSTCNRRRGRDRARHALSTCPACRVA